MSRYELKFNREYLDRLAKEFFIKIAGDEKLWDEIEEARNSISPVCFYNIYDEIKVEENHLVLDENISLHSPYFSTLPSEILGSVACFAMTVGELPKDEESITKTALIDMAGTAYIDALRKVLSGELEEDYLVSGMVAPGIGEMPFEEIRKFEEIFDFSKLGISVNESFVMSPEKSATGIYMLFTEAHPENHNSCDVCMSRGYGCNFCSINGAK